MHSGGERFEQRRLFQVHRFGHQPRILDRGDAIFRKSTAEAAGIEAEIEPTALAHCASSARPERIQSDVIAYFEFSHPRAELDDLAGWFMADNRGHTGKGAVSAEFPEVDMQI